MANIPLSIRDSLCCLGRQIRDIRSSISDISDDSGNIEVIATATSLNVFVPAGDGGKSSEWEVVFLTNAAKHLSKWGLHYLYATERLGPHNYTRRLGGNSLTSDNSTWEHAVQVQGDADFSGGIAHGWEKLTSVTFFVDGKPWTPATGNFKCRNLRLTQQCDLFRWKANSGDPEDLIARTTEIFNFSAEGLTLRQSMRFAASLTLQTAYLGMWPLMRSVTGPPFRQITSRAIRNNDGTPEDISVPGFTIKYTTGTNRVLMWDPTAEIVADWQQTISTGSEVLSFIINSAQYNKLYRQACAVGAAVTASTIWETEHRFRLST